MYNVTFRVLGNSIAVIENVLAANENEATILAGLDMYYAGHRTWKIISVNSSF